MLFFKIAAKNLWNVKTRTLFTVIAIALGCALLTGITVLNESYLESYINGVSDQLGFTDIGIKRHTDDSDGYFTADDLEEELDLKKIDGYLDHTGRIISEHIVIDQLEQTQDLAYESMIFGIDIEDDEGYGYAEITDYLDEIDDPETIEDVLEEDPSKYCVITTWIEEVYDYELGEEIYLPYYGDNSTNLYNSSTWAKYKIAAIINDFAEGYDITHDYSSEVSDSFITQRAIYFDIDEVRKMVNVESSEINLLYVHCELEKILSFYEEIEQNLPSDFYADNIKSGELEVVYDNVRTTQLIMIVFITISFIIAAMLTANTLMMSVNEQKYQIGVMRAQGIQKQEIFKIFLFEASILSLIGSALGIFMGIGLSPILKDYYFEAQLADSNFELNLIFNIASLMIIFGIVASLSILIGLAPAYVATKVQIIEAIRNIPTKNKYSKVRRFAFPIIGLVLTIIGLAILTISQRNLFYTLIGIIPFILGLIMVSTMVIPILTKGISYLLSYFLGALRKVTQKNLERNPKQTKISFIMFGLAIGFLVMISSVLHSLEIVYNGAIPNYLGADIIIVSEGSTFGMDEIAIEDSDIIDGAIEEATVVNKLSIKADGYGTPESLWKIEPKVNLYIIEGEKFFETVNDIKMRKTLDEMDNEDIFKYLDEQPDSAIISYQLADKDHLNKGIEDEVELEVGDFKFTVNIIGITELITGVPETWQEPHEITPVKSKGRYCVFVSWNTMIPYIDNIYPELPEADLVIKGEDHDLDYWDFPYINRSYVRNQILDYSLTNGYNLTIAERVWGPLNYSLVADPIYNNFEDLDEINSMNVNFAFENPILKGTTVFYDSRYGHWTTIQEAITNGTNQCVITEDVYDKLGIGVDDEISVWYTSRKTFEITRVSYTIAGIIKMNSTFEGINFDSKNPYVRGKHDVGDDDTDAIIVDINSLKNSTASVYEDFFGNNDTIVQYWIKLPDYYKLHLKVATELQEILGQDYAVADFRWIFTSEYAHAPYWYVQVDEDEYSQEEAVENLKEFLLFNKMPVVSWVTVDGLREQFSDQFQFQKSFFSIILGFALIIAVLGIMINMLISISNRKREIGMMRAIGIFKKELLKMILGETLMLVFSGFLMGCIIGLISAQQLLLGLPLDLIFDLKLYIDRWTIISLLGLVFIITLMAAAIPSIKILKLDVIDSLKST